MSAVMDDEGFDLLVWEGASDLALRAERCLASHDVAVIRADHDMAFTVRRDPVRRMVALVSVSVMGEGRFIGHDWLTAHAIPVIWVASEDRDYDPRFYPQAYSYTLPLSFTAAELRSLSFKLAGAAGSAGAAKSSDEAPPPFIAVSSVMCDVLAEAEVYADSSANVLVYGETGVGKERIARLLHERSPQARGPFVAVNCGAIPEGLFEAHFFGHAKGAFTGAVGSHRGYFEQANDGTLFLDEIGDLPLYQQVKLLRVLEQSTVTRLGSTQEILVRFRLITATHRDLRRLVEDGSFRADLYYRLAVIELNIPNLEQRGPAEKQAIFLALLDRTGRWEQDSVPQWVLDRVARMRFAGNVRELANLVERVGLVRRQFGAWDRQRLERVFERIAAPVREAPHAEREAESILTEEDHRERECIIQALDANGWRRQDTAAQLGISRKVLWEKMRKLQIAGRGENAAA